MLSVTENGKVYFQANAKRADSDSHLYEGFSRCLPHGFALQENIIRAARCEVEQSGGSGAGSDGG